MNAIALAGLIGAVVWGTLALTMFWLGEHMIAGTAFILLSLSIYIWETRKDA